MALELDSLSANLSITDDDSGSEQLDNTGLKQSKKASYKDKKLENKLKKLEIILKNLESINRVSYPTKFLFAGNCGLDNNISRENIENKFEKFGRILDIVMQTKKSYAFVVYENDDSTQHAIDNLQGRLIEYATSEPPVSYYLFPVDKVPSLCALDNEPVPTGLEYFEDFIDSEYAQEIIDFINNDQQSFAFLKNRRVKHYGYEFRYGTNDVDEKKPLECPVPSILDKLLEKCLNSGLISAKPDQLTVNAYEPGQGIPPHVDNINAFTDYIMSLSLVSCAVMEFRLKTEKKTQLSSLCLKPNSIVVLKSDARYKWSHSISERKHDLIQSKDGNITLMKRGVRISLTFRKLSDKAVKQTDSSATDLIKLPNSDLEAKKFESTYVHNVYNQIAEHFSSTRHSAWPGVVKFINSLEPYTLMLDVGCGNGKYLNIRDDLVCFGCDYSTELINICKKRNFNCFTSDCLNIACPDGRIDYVISIAVLHHLSTPERRTRALNEMLRILKVGGRGLVTVWAREQKLNEKESYYIQKTKNKKQPSEEFRIAKENSDIQIESEQQDQKDNQSSIQKPSVHEYGKPFEKQDLFVTWHYQKINENKKKQQDVPTMANEENNNLKDSDVFLRFYHVFKCGELEDLFESIENVKILESYYEQGNWCCTFEKIF